MSNLKKHPTEAELREQFRQDFIRDPFSFTVPHGDNASDKVVEQPGDGIETRAFGTPCARSVARECRVSLSVRC